MSTFTSSDFLRHSLADHARSYATKTQRYLANPANKEVVVRGSVSSVVRELLDAYRHDEQSLKFFRDELVMQSGAVDQLVEQLAGNNAQN